MIYTLHIHLIANKSKHKNTKTFRPSFFYTFTHIPNLLLSFYIILYTKSTEKKNIIGIDVLTMCEIDLLIAAKKYIICENENLMPSSKTG